MITFSNIYSPVYVRATPKVKGFFLRNVVLTFPKLHIIWTGSTSAAAASAPDTEKNLHFTCARRSPSLLTSTGWPLFTDSSATIHRQCFIPFHRYQCIIIITRAYSLAWSTFPFTQYNVRCYVSERYLTGCWVCSPCRILSITLTAHNTRYRYSVIALLCLWLVDWLAGTSPGNPINTCTGIDTYPRNINNGINYPLWVMCKESERRPEEHKLAFRFIGSTRTAECFHI